MLVVSAVGSSAAAERALDKPFAATPNELLALARTAPAGDWPVVILRDENDIRIDAVGKVVTRWRCVFVVRTQAGIDSWGTLRAGWRPFYQNKPVFRARVIDPSGRVAELDPSLLSDAPAVTHSANVFSDRRVVQTPLPRLQIGSVVEEEVVASDRDPLPSAGNVDVAMLGSDVPTSSTVLSYSVPAASKAHLVERKLPAGVRARHQVAGGRESWVYEIGALPARPEPEWSVPSDVVVRPYVGVSTAASWAAVARAYRAVVERRIVEGAFGLPAELPRAATIETLRAIVAWLHREVRYTGIEFGEASNVPWPPAETVKRGFGDCKDQATLLVALLRQAGIRADLALLLTGPGRDVDAELPGIAQFDHAIVRAQIGGRDVWIDGTEELTRPGQLPMRDQGRRVLVIADDTKQLTTTPMSVSADNVVREVRTFAVGEQGASRVTEVSRAGGVIEGEQREWVRDVRGEELSKTLGTYADSEYGGALDRTSSSDPGDLATPFERTIAVKDVRRVYADREQIDVYLYPSAALPDLPHAVTAKPTTPRVNDFSWWVPIIYEVENRIALPSGFTLPAEMPERTRAIGTATLTERRKIDGQTLIVTYRFDSGKQRLTPGELATLQTAVADLRKEEVHLKIEHTGLALGHAGKPREAIAECERLIALHPTEALHHSQLAQVLMGVGAGAAARREARKAVALAPGDADAHVVLGWSLSYDTLGREYTYDWDRAGAIAALRKAVKLDPKHAGGAVALAQVLQRDSFGRAWEGDADLRGAADAWRAAIELDNTDEHALALVQVLARSGQFAEAERAARALKQSEQRDGWIIAAVAARSGGKEALRVAGEMQSGSGRVQAIHAAGSVLLVLQRYDLARELFAESGSMAKLPAAQAALFSKVTTHPPIKSGTADPRAAAADLVMTLIDPHRKTSVFWDARLEKSFRDLPNRLLPAALRAAGMTPFLADLAQSQAAVQLEGDAGVWRASFETDNGHVQAYLALDNGIVKLVGGPDMAAALGRYLMRTTDARSDPRARRLLDWIRSDLDKSTAHEVATFRKLWGPGVPASHDAILLAAAVLADGSDPERAIPIGLRCTSTLPDAEVACHEVLFAAYTEAARWADAAAQVAALDALGPAAAVADRAPMRVWALVRAGRFDDAEHAIDEVLAKDPDHHGARIARFDIAAQRGQVAEALKRADSILGDTKPSPIVQARALNNVAWYRLVVGNDLPAALDLAHKAVEKSPRSSEALNTRAAIEAELGDLDRAAHDSWKAMEQRGSFEPIDADWYVVGRIAEQLGLTADAAAAYKRVPPSKINWESTYMLAQRRLAALPVAAAPPAAAKPTPRRK